MKILINTAITTEHHQQIQSVSDQVRIFQTQDHQKILQEVVDTDIVFVVQVLKMVYKLQKKWETKDDTQIETFIELTEDFAEVCKISL